MKASAKKYVTTGVALVGAGVIAAGPIAPAPANVPAEGRSHDVALMAANTSEIQRQFEAQRALLETFAPGAALEDFIEGTLAAFNRPGGEAVNDYDPVTGFDSVGRIGQGFAASALRIGSTALAPLRLIELAQAISEGDGAEGFEAFVKNIVDAPLWAIDPALFALRDALPAPLGGPDGLVATIRNQLYRLTLEINEGLQDPGALVQRFVNGTIEAFEQPGPVEYDAVEGPIEGFSRVTEGVIASTLRLAAATVLGPVGVVQVAAAVAQGDTEAALDAVENIVDGPLWVADPALYGLRDALPAPIGGPGNLVENFRNGLWSATERINGAIEDVVVRADAPAGPGVTTLVTGNQRVARLAADAPEASLQEEPAAKNETGPKPASEQPKPVKQENRRLTGLLPKNLLPKRQPSARDLVRNSLNFSPGAKTGTQAATGEGAKVDVDIDVSKKTDAAGAAPTGTTQGTTPGDNGAGGNDGGNKPNSDNNK
ncbi:hypothetical protein AU184_13935 [Mycolicibacterium novocastrense]|uniref:hypothetical protein n=1 Tax=Mycolicibacterium novocastrense TaxID=59813 RepID=UPI000748E5CA|nr:hypothetical protein [Mycolicibacterium novocastrense]KUH69916.1 hypothetical protein AU183_10250 [Mycolicibacterium novocastrense]KUH78089.1 hypothetical protein AU072_09015 [Mycolicibacterium novocastrense]KUH79424.1 hypothetical protein AU184_13935 [Mycolicibacterium novocastrense]